MPSVTSGTAASGSSRAASASFEGREKHRRQIDNPTLCKRITSIKRAECQTGRPTSLSNHAKPSQARHLDEWDKTPAPEKVPLTASLMYMVSH